MEIRDAVMMLVDEGEVELDAPVEEYLPEFKGQWLAVESGDERMLLRKPGRPIRVRDLLTHTSGLVHFLGVEDPGSRRFEILPLREATRLYALTPLRFEPGSRWMYCNAGLNTAGRIIEVVGRMPYENFLKRRLFDPLDMSDTALLPLPGTARPSGEVVRAGRDEARARGDGRAYRQASAGRWPDQPVPRGRPVLDGPRRGPLLPDVPEWRDASGAGGSSRRMP